MLLDCVLVLLDFVVSSAEIAVVCWDPGLDFNGLFGELYLLVVLLHLAQCLAFQVVEITGFIELQSLVAAFTELFPLFEVHKGIGLHEVLLFGIGHGLGQFVDFVIVFISLHDFDFRGDFVSGFDNDGSAIFVVVEFDLHLFW